MPVRGAKLCGAKKRGRDGTCTQPAMQNGRCKLHGGLSPPPGPAHPKWKHGNSSKWAGTIVEKREQIANDPQLFDLRGTASTLRVCVDEAMERVEELDTPNFRQRALALYREVRDNAQTDPEASGRALGKLGQLLGRGAQQTSALNVLSQAASRLARHVEGAWKIKLAGDNAMNVQEVETRFAQFIDICLMEMKNKDEARRVMERAQRELAIFARPVTESEEVVEDDD